MRLLSAMCQLAIVSAGVRHEEGPLAASLLAGLFAREQATPENAFKVCASRPRAQARDVVGVSLDQVLAEAPLLDEGIRMASESLSNADYALCRWGLIRGFLGKVHGAMPDIHKGEADSTGTQPSQ